MNNKGRFKRTIERLERIAKELKVDSQGVQGKTLEEVIKGLEELNKSLEELNKSYQ